MSFRRIATAALLSLAALAPAGFAGAADMAVKAKPIVDVPFFFVNDNRVLMTTGSHHMQAYWVSATRGRLVRLVQLVYLFDDRRWLPRTS